MEEPPTSAPDRSAPARQAALATLTRAFGWSMLAVLAIFLVNTLLTLAGGWPGPASVFGAEASARGALQLGLYILGVAVAVALVRRSRHTALRADSERIAAFNAFLIRAAFFGVLFVGLGDALVSFLRVEELLAGLIGEDLERNLARSQFRGVWMHVPLMLLGIALAAVTRTLGFVWLSLLIVAAELLIVITRFVFSYEQAFMGDLVRFWYAALFLFASAYTLYEEGHVRVDVLYAGLSLKAKAVVNAVGSVLLGMTLCWTILLVGLGGRSSVIYAPIRSFETSQSGYGMYVKYLMAGFLAVFAVTMLIQFVSHLFGAVADLLDEPGHVDHEASPVAG